MLCWLVRTHSRSAYSRAQLRRTLLRHHTHRIGPMARAGGAESGDAEPIFGRASDGVQRKSSVGATCECLQTPLATLSRPTIDY